MSIKVHPVQTSLSVDASTVTTKIDLHIQEFTLALLLELKDRPGGTQLLQEIVQKALPKNVPFTEGVCLDSVQSKGDIVSFEFVAPRKMLANPYANVTVKQSSWYTLNTGIIGSQSYSSLFGQGATVQLASSGNSTLYYPPVRPIMQPENKYVQAHTEEQDAFSLLVEPHSAAGNGTHIIYHTDLGTYHVFTTDNAMEPDVKLYTASDKEDLQRYFEHLRNEHENACLFISNAPVFPSVLTARVWRKAQY